MSDTYKEIEPWEYAGLKSYVAHEPQVKGYLEGYAAALADVMYRMTGESSCGKSYDPMKVKDGFMFSYAFDMKDGGRKHPLSDYDTIGDIQETLISETLDWVKDGPDKEIEFDQDNGFDIEAVLKSLTSREWKEWQNE